MSAERLPSLHTGVGIASHAHPLAVADSISSDDADHQYLESLMANVSSDVELCGLALHSNASPNEMHCPRLRRSESKQRPSTAPETLVQANMVTQFPGNVLFERVSRYVVKGEIVDLLQVDATPEENKPQAEDASTPPMPSDTSTTLSKTHDLRRIPRIRSVDWDILKELRKRHLNSPKKRKASLRSTSYDRTLPVELVHVEPDACLKRQKLELSSDIDLHATVADLEKDRTAAEECKAMLEALEVFRRSVDSRSSDERRPSEVIRRMREALTPTLDLAYATVDKELSDLKEGDCSTPVKKMEAPDVQPPTPPHFTMESDSSYASDPNSASNASDLDTNKSLGGTNILCSPPSAELSQDEIQKNYREFEEVARRRKTDPTSASTCDVGDMNFERIFLEDSEVSDGFDDASGLSDDMDGLLMDED